MRIQEIIPVCLDARTRWAIDGHEDIRVADGQFRGAWELPSARYAERAGYPPGSELTSPNKVSISLMQLGEEKVVLVADL
jgi:hypothetical protein